jgi:hypothetical protein
VKSLDLGKSTKYWADMIINNKNYIDSIKNNGYDVPGVMEDIEYGTK